MSSLLARFRTRASSQTTATSESSQSALGPSTPTNMTRTTHPLPAAAIERKIHPEVNSLFEEYSAAEPVPSSVAPAFSPHIRRQSSEAIPNPLRPRRPSLPVAPMVSLNDEDEETRPPSPDSRSSRISGGGRLLSRISSLASPGEWSTFGRGKHRPTSEIGDFGEQPSAWYTRKKSRSKAGSKASSMRSSTTHNRSADPSRRSASKTPSNKSSDRTFGTNKENNDIASSQHSATPSSRPRSNTTPASHSSRFARISTPASRNHVFDSPGTFGRPSSSSSSPSGIAPPPSPPPPLPPLDHPELASVLLSRSNPSTTQIRNPEFYDHFSPELHIHGKTFPPISVGRNFGQDSYPAEGDAGDKLGPFDFGRAVRPYRSLPKVQYLFPSLSPDTPEFPATGLSLSRARSQSQPHQSRRTSADLFALQASADTPATESVDNWAARVSREMVRLSLADGNEGRGNVGQPPDSAPRPAAAEENKEMAVHGRVHNVPWTAHSSSSFPSISSSPLAGRPLSFLSPPQEGPLYLSASTAPTRDRGVDSFMSLGTEVDKGKARERMPDQSHEKGVASGTGSTGTAAGAKILRSSMKGNKDSLRSSQRAVRPPGYLASSSKSPDAGPSSLVPSVSFTTPTSTSPEMHRFSRTASEPFQTPTRARTESSTSNAKGKRKAEDVDLTPPDLKAGQRAMFMIPADPRTFHRSSNAPRVPSSYHRKRARLSSPHPTPASSRAGSTTSPPNYTGTWSSNASSRAPARPSSRAPSAHSGSVPGPSSVLHTSLAESHERRRSLSQVSIPISALITPHVPSVGRSSTFHMRDPRRPSRKLETPWTLRFKSDEEEGSPVQAWLFFFWFFVVSALVARGAVADAEDEGGRRF
ncbi:hypothetical protein EW146_g3516 [Bondarzewia mesenterica]|uniref:Uncharacterized protein n=1 Tax=Bondarzewia mesenterica TaxID=1095465 RepID=A0A4S4LXA9_9AGAM|nr:hypothetical protein EW146_g3516 [Bondarzewia mesenterica]